MFLYLRPHYLYQTIPVSNPVYELTFHDLYMILSNSLLPKEHRYVWGKTHAHTDWMHVIDKTYPMAVPNIDHSENYNEDNDCWANDHLVTCLPLA